MATETKRDPGQRGPAPPPERVAPPGGEAEGRAENCDAGRASRTDNNAVVESGQGHSERPGRAGVAVAAADGQRPANPASRAPAAAPGRVGSFRRLAVDEQGGRLKRPLSDVAADAETAPRALRDAGLEVVAAGRREDVREAAWIDFCNALAERAEADSAHNREWPA